ncbi:hypothetical protein ISF_06327 [Cordyceps fumosorosea ARSEF 2679]|uniref:Uncharacterized protein n=1 Tax=Cordyceps fumosorosea (strain ARSEF 2679) TaxID=1081104 RepID=A0A167S9E3_CORFA|nr:hypothetical protein ISF_06327 [Cordyceps fumosorosea ARSEF 2679]OAA59392.1 hypothetical protein ISF_06327 [Cordyceps fumosorosea ARSEF 2679]
MRLHWITSAVLAAAAATNYYNGALCHSSLDCLKICQQGDFKVIQSSEGQPQLACALGIVEYSRKTCLSRHGRGDENIKLLGDACAGARGLLCDNFCVVRTLDPGRFEDQCRGMGGVPSTIMGGLTEAQAKGQEVCSSPALNGVR